MIVFKNGADEIIGGVDEKSYIVDSSAHPIGSVHELIRDSVHYKVIYNLAGQKVATIYPSGIILDPNNKSAGHIQLDGKVKKFYDRSDKFQFKIEPAPD